MGKKKSRFIFIYGTADISFFFKLISLNKKLQYGIKNSETIVKSTKTGVKESAKQMNLVN